MKKLELSPNSFGVAAAAIALIMWVFSFGWGGMMGGYGMMGAAYPGMMSGSFALLSLIGMLVVAYIIGYVFALVYNYMEKRG